MVVLKVQINRCDKKCQVDVNWNKYLILSIRLPITCKKFFFLLHKTTKSGFYWQDILYNLTKFGVHPLKTLITLTFQFEVSIIKTVLVLQTIQLLILRKYLPPASGAGRYCFQFVSSHLVWGGGGVYPSSCQWGVGGTISGQDGSPPSQVRTGGVPPCQVRTGGTPI